MAPRVNKKRTSVRSVPSLRIPNQRTLLVEDFLLPNLVTGDLAPHLRWLDEVSHTFSMSRIHGSRASWNVKFEVVSVQWSKMKNLWDENDKKKIVKAKHRLACAMRKHKNIVQIGKPKEEIHFQLIMKDDWHDRIASLRGRNVTKSQTSRTCSRTGSPSKRRTRNPQRKSPPTPNKPTRDSKRKFSDDPTSKTGECSTEMKECLPQPNKPTRTRREIAKRDYGFETDQRKLWGMRKVKYVNYSELTDRIMEVQEQNSNDGCPKASCESSLAKVKTEAIKEVTTRRRKQEISKKETYLYLKKENIFSAAVTCDESICEEFVDVESVRNNFEDSSISTKCQLKDISVVTNSKSKEISVTMDSKSKDRLVPIKNKSKDRSVRMKNQAKDRSVRMKNQAKDSSVRMKNKTEDNSVQMKSQPMLWNSPYDSNEIVTRGQLEPVKLHRLSDVLGSPPRRAFSASDDYEWSMDASLLSDVLKPVTATLPKDSCSTICSSDDNDPVELKYVPLDILPIVDNEVEITLEAEERDPLMHDMTNLKITDEDLKSVSSTETKVDKKKVTEEKKPQNLSSLHSRNFDITNSPAAGQHVSPRKTYYVFGGIFYEDNAVPVSEGDSRPEDSNKEKIVIKTEKESQSSSGISTSWLNINNNSTDSIEASQVKLEEVDLTAEPTAIAENKNPSDRRIEASNMKMEVDLTAEPTVSVKNQNPFDGLEASRIKIEEDLTAEPTFSVKNNNPIYGLGASHLKMEEVDLTVEPPTSFMKREDEGVDPMLWGDENHYEVLDDDFFISCLIQRYECEDSPIIDQESIPDFDNLDLIF